VRRGERGSAAVEAALVFPIILMLTIGLMEYGKYFYDVYRYQQAVYSGARVGAITEGENDAKEAAAKNEVKRILTNMGMVYLESNVYVTFETIAGLSSKTAIKVNIIVNPYKPIIGIDRVVMPKYIDVSASELNY